ncbi:MAG TPA: mechanosensitive ion channel family protein [Steroidobacteraceae bacterium]|nr:mechanosensitive ion channel family protein [Steroidobacteraceae bacterium]
MNDVKVGEHDIVSLIRPDTLIGAIAYLVIFVVIALILSRLLRTAVHASLTRADHVDRTTVSFLQQILTALIWVVMLTLYAHLIPVLNSLGTALLTGVSVASVVIGLAAQSTLGNLVAGVSITIYRPFRLGDTLQVAAPTGTEIGVVELISLGYTTLRAPAGHLIVVPNSVAASQVTINLNSNATFAPWPLVITIRLGRNVDVEAARQLAIKVANEKGDARALLGCYLTKVEATAVTLELRLVANDGPHRDQLRSILLAELSRRFSEAHLPGSENQAPTFS